MKFLIHSILFLISVAGLRAEPVEMATREKAVIKLDQGEMVFRYVDPSKYEKSLPAFYLLETEVTNRMYARYLRDIGKAKGDRKLWREEKERRERGIGGHTASAVYDVDDESLLWQGKTPPKGKEDFPVAFIRHADAMAYCEWLSKRHMAVGEFRLPTKDEWLLVAYGSERKFPWGDQRNLSIPCLSPSEDKLRRVPVSVKQPTKDVTPEGIRHLWGNVREYIQNPHGGDDVYWMGPSFKTYAQEDGWPLKARQDYWGFVHDPNSRMEGLGFRVLLVPKAEDSSE